MAGIQIYPSRLKKQFYRLEFIKKTQYETYIKIQDQISIAYKELRNNEALKRFNKKYENINKEQQDVVKKAFPMRVSESIKE